jgi:hypothetical protein
MDYLVKIGLFGAFTGLLMYVINLFFSKISLDFLTGNFAVAAWILQQFGVFKAINAYLSALASAWAVQQIIDFWKSA